MASWNWGVTQMPFPITLVRWPALEHLADQRLRSVERRAAGIRHFTAGRSFCQRTATLRKRPDDTCCSEPERRWNGRSPSARDGPQ